MIRVAAIAVAAVLTLTVGRAEFYATHLGAPPLTYPCPSGTFTKEWWVPDSDPTGQGAPGTLEYHGWREIASCASSTTANVGG